MSNKYHILVPLAVTASLFVSSCGSMRNTATIHRTTKVEADIPRGDNRTFDIPTKLPKQSHALLAEAKKWLGTPYKYGGEDHRGVDCSGLVLSVYKTALDIKLPRNSSEQASYCSPLPKDKIMPGDLLFFATSGSRDKVSHVGLYVGDGKMIHSSASRGVIISNISEDYYTRTFTGAGYVDKYRRMLDTDIQIDQIEKTAVPTITPVTTATVKNVKSDPEPSVEEARQAVLNSLIEQKLDSIFNNRP